MSTPLPLPPLASLLTLTHREALGAFAAAGWQPWAHPIGLDAERRRTLNIDLTEPEMAYLEGSTVRAVAHTEVDRHGDVTLVEIVAAEPARPVRVAAALWPGHPGEPRTGGGAAAREWIWGPESGATARVGGEPVRLWICAEQAYGDRLWAVATVVRRAGQDEE